MIEVIKPGLYTTIQDLGRYGFRSMGVPVSGPMDSSSASLSNQLLGNEPNAALIEMAYVGATFLFHKPAIIALSGAKSKVKLNNELIEDQSILKIEAGSTLSFGAMRDGNFLYLSILGGFNSEKVLGSACYFKAVNGLSRMEKGTKLYFDETIQENQINAVEERTSPIKPSQFIQVEKGPEFDLLSESTKRALVETEFTISMQSNRMGFRLTERLNAGANEIITSPVQPGTVQLTQSGQLVVLMRDAQTTGGYSRALQLTPLGIDQLAQTGFGEALKFQLVD